MKSHQHGSITHTHMNIPKAIPVIITVRYDEHKYVKTPVCAVRHLVSVPLHQPDLPNPPINLPSFLLCNARSAYNKFDELSITILDYKADVCAITETWFKHDMPPEIVAIPGYTMFAKSRLNRNGGGVAVYAKHYLNPCHLNEVIVPANLEVVWIKLRPSRLPRSIPCIFCATIYYPQPDKAIETQLTEHILSTIDLLSTKHHDAGFVIVGDFNQLNTDPLLSDQRYRQIVDRPTRGKNTLDKIISNISDLYDSVRITSPIGLSDQYTILWFPKENQPKQCNLTRHRYSRPMPDSALRAFGTWIGQKLHQNMTSTYSANISPMSLTCSSRLAKPNYTQMTNHGCLQE